MKGLASHRSPAGADGPVGKTPVHAEVRRLVRTPCVTIGVAHQNGKRRAAVDAAGQRRIPSWPFLLGLAAIGGGPTFVGTWVGHGFTSVALSVVFLSLAAGSITYVILQLVAVASKARRPDLVATGLLIGLFAGFLTDGILVAAGV